MYIENFMGSYNMPCELKTINGVQYFRIQMNPYSRHTAQATEGLNSYDAVFRPTSIDRQYNGWWKGNDGEPLTAFDLYPTNVQYLAARIVDNGYYYSVNLDGGDSNADNPNVGFFMTYYDKNGDKTGEYGVYGGLRLTIFKGNATAVDYKDGEVCDTYSVQLKKYQQNGQDRLEIGNFMNNGCCLEVTRGALSSYRWACQIGNPDASIDYNNKTISIDEIGAAFEIDYWYYGENTLSMGYNDYTAYYCGHNGTYGTHFYYCGDTDPSSNVPSHQPITGHFETFDNPKHINYDHDAWVTNDGTVRTKDGGWMLELDGTAYHDNSTILNRVDRTVIQPLELQDITADFDLNLKKFEINIYNGVGQCNVQADVVPQNNCQYIDSYDLYVVPKAMSSINEFAEGEHSYTDGHVKAVKVATLPAASAASAARAANSMVSFNKDFTLSGDNLNSDVKDYSVFVKANYKPATQLESTFHRLTPVTGKVVSSIDLTDAAAVTVKAGNGTIEVEGADNVAVYTLTGVQIYNGPSGSIPAAPGLYLVKAAGKAHKILVK